jgi:manganese/zinc/iron transport system ATP- binding protein
MTAADAARPALRLVGAQEAAPDRQAEAALSIRGLTVAYTNQPVLFSIDLDLPTGAMSAIIGPNGAGKSSLLKAVVGILPVVSGEISCLGGTYRAQRRQIAYVPQTAAVDWEFPARVIDVVLMGRYHRQRWYAPTRRTDRAQALACLDRVGMADFACRQIGQLSGGQRQRVFLARALAQEASLYLLDEPFAGIDVATERAILVVLHELCAQGLSVVCVHHDLATVPDYFDHLALINRRMIAAGPVARTFTQSALAATYGGRLGAAGLAATVAATATAVL